MRVKMNSMKRMVVKVCKFSLLNSNLRVKLNQCFWKQSNFLTQLA